ncbi:hypothetical protein ISN45_Aa04g034290 [Arabidopsis thaliana x Arabidopsis arenosa]|uniref:Uncharacterized protein n=1 Tax=Arabidopsis thaliana x Arabidopsis arenosa TaxID=1240361 RepID=A0A8T2ABC3_9BRAS|nr:hypothetical protein ISN45_Aa04g034290 [Arabidopsis thaliana x Arabidopsis arenosa]
MFETRYSAINKDKKNHRFCIIKSSLKSLLVLGKLTSMAKNSSESSSKKKQENRVCEKIFRAVTSPVRTVRRISTKPSPAEAVRVKFAETPTQAAKPITKMKPVIARVETSIKTDERFTDYIKKAKLKIRAMTNVGDMMKEDAWETSETDQTRHDDHHHHVPISHVGSSGRSSDQFSEYIKKAKMKLRSSSTIARANPTFK